MRGRGKQITFGVAAQEGLAAGERMMARTAAVTLGPRGRYVAWDAKDKRTPSLSNDGAMAVGNIDLPDSLQNAGMKVVREAAMAANLGAGDGTTTATVLADALVTEGVRAVVAGAEPLALRRGMQKACDALVEALRASAQPVTTAEQLAEVAIVAAGDEKIGRTVADALASVGTEGVVSVEKSNVFGISHKVQKGMMWGFGFISPQMADDMGAMVTELHQPYILITDQRLADNFDDVIPVLEEVAKSGHPLLICADDVRGVSLKSLLANNARGKLKTVAVKAPGLGERRKNEAEDLAVLTGGTFVTEAQGLRLRDVTKAMLGRAESAIITKDSCVVVGGKGKQEAVDARKASIRAQLDGTVAGESHDVLRERLGKLSGGIAVISVGAATETEQDEIRSRIQDALRATRSAAEEGLVAGGGVALGQAAQAFGARDFADEDERRGAEIVRTAAWEPAKAIAANAGFDPEVVAHGIASAPAGEGLDAATGEWGPMIARGIADPAKVTRVALESAVSVAGLILITDAAVVGN